MKKAFLAMACIAGFAMAAEAGVVKGLTKPRRNPAGGTTYDCDGNPNKICNTSTLNSNGTIIVIVYHYDAEGNLTGTTKYYTNSDPGVPDTEGGFINEIPTDYGTVYGKPVAP